MSRGVLGYKNRARIFWLGTSLLLVLLLVLSPACGVKSPSSPSVASPSPSPASPLPAHSPTPSLSVAPASPTASPMTASPTQGIGLISTEVEPRFPRSISFRLKARSGALISKAELEYVVDKISPAEVIVVVFPHFAPGKEIEASWLWDMRKASLPPGAKLKYRWKLWDLAGNRLTTGFKGFRFDDQRYKWQELEQGKVTLFWYQGDRNFARELMSRAQETLRELAEDTGAELKRSVEIWVYASAADLQRAMIFPEEWMGGAAFPKFGLVAIGISPANLAWGKRAIAHELTHLVIYQVTFNPYNDLPTWLNEGLAMHSEGELRSDLKSALEQGISQDRLFSVRSLCSSFPAGTEEAKLCYAQSYSLVEFLLQRYGREKMLQLLLTFKEGTTYDEALLKVYGLDLDGLDRLWRESLRSSQMAEAKGQPAEPVNLESKGLEPALVNLGGF